MYVQELTQTRRAGDATRGHCGVTAMIELYRTPAGLSDSAGVIWRESWRSTRTGGVLDFVNPETGELVEAASVQVIHASLKIARKLLQKPVDL